MVSAGRGRSGHVDRLRIGCLNSRRVRWDVGAVLSCQAPGGTRTEKWLPLWQCPIRRGLVYT